jgi:hypothetical protein
MGLHRAHRDCFHAQHRVGRLPRIGDLGARVGILVEDDDVGFAHLDRLGRALFRPAALGTATIDAFPFGPPHDPGLHEEAVREEPPVPDSDHHDDLLALLSDLQPGPFDGRLARSLARDARIARTPRQRPSWRVARLRSVRLAGRLLRARYERKKKHSKSSAALGCVPPTSGPVYRESFSRFTPAG